MMGLFYYIVSYYIIHNSGTHQDWIDAAIFPYFLQIILPFLQYLSQCFHFNVKVCI